MRSVYGATATSVDILRKIRRSMACAVACVELLYGYQESEEIVEGTSIFRNGVGLDKLDAKFLHDKDVSKLSKYDAVRIAAKYTDTQLVPAVQRKELVLSRYEDDADCDRQTRSRSYLAHLLAVADDDAEDNDFSIVRRDTLDDGLATYKDEREKHDDEEEEEEEKEPTRLSLSNFGLRADAFFAPSVQFSTRCLAIAEELRVDGVFDPTEVRKKINTELYAAHAQYEQNDVDLALYYAQRTTFDRIAVGMRVRVFWEKNWVTAAVRKIGRQPIYFVEVFFKDDNSVCKLTNDRLQFIYVLSEFRRDCKRKRRNCARVVLEDSE